MAEGGDSSRTLTGRGQERPEETHIYEEISTLRGGSSVSDAMVWYQRMSLSTNDHWNPLLDSANQLIRESKFEDAISLLEGLPERQTQQLMLAECYFQLNNNNKAMRSFGKLENMMTSSPRPKVDDVMKTIVRYIGNSSYIRALILLPCASKLYKIDPNPNDAVRGVKKCTFIFSFKVFKRMVEQGGRMRAIAKDFGAEVHLEMLADLRSIAGADDSVKANMEARCLNCIGGSYGFVDEYLKSIEYCQRGIDLMKRSFGSNAKKYVTFGSLTNNIGLAHELWGNYVEAEKSYLRSLESCNKAKDWKSDNQRMIFADETMRNLQRVRRELKR